MRTFLKASKCVFHFGPEDSTSWIDLVFTSRSDQDYKSKQFSQNKVHKYPDRLTHEQKSNQEDVVFLLANIIMLLEKGAKQPESIASGTTLVRWEWRCQE